MQGNSPECMQEIVNDVKSSGLHNRQGKMCFIFLADHCHGAQKAGETIFSLVLYRAGCRHRGKTVDTIRQKHPLSLTKYADKLCSCFVISDGLQPTNLVGHVCSAKLSERFDKLSISPGRHRRRRPARKRTYCGCRCKEDQTIPIIVTDRSRPRIHHPLCTLTHDSVRPPTVKCSTEYGISYFNLIKIDTGPFIQEFSKHFKIMFLNAQSVRNKVLDICDYIMQANVDLVFLCETWLRPVGDEADCAALTPPGFCLKSLPQQSGTGGGIAVLHRTSLTRNIAVSTRDFVFTAFETCEVRLSSDGHTAVFLSVYTPPPSQQNKLMNVMFLKQFYDLLESCVVCLFLFCFLFFFVIGFL